MTASVHPLHPAAPNLPAAAPGPAPEKAGPFSNPLTEKCANAALTASRAATVASRALYAAEYALDEVQRLALQLAAARKQLTDATNALRPFVGDLDRMAAAFVERMPKA